MVLIKHVIIDHAKKPILLSFFTKILYYLTKVILHVIIMLNETEKNPPPFILPTHNLWQHRHTSESTTCGLAKLKNCSLATSLISTIQGVRVRNSNR